MALSCSKNAIFAGEYEWLKEECMKIRQIFLVAALVCACQMQAQDTKTFLKEYKQFVEQLEQKDSLTAQEYAVADSTYGVFQEKYHNGLKEKMTNDEVSEYMEYRTRYNRKVIGRKSGKVIQKIDSVGNVVGKNIQRSASKVGGFVKGLFKKN